MDFCAMDDDELSGLLLSYGVDETLHLQRNEMIALLQSFEEVPCTPALPAVGDPVDVGSHVPVDLSPVLSQQEDIDQMTQDFGGIISSFQDITGLDAQTAQHYLEACGWDLEQALIMYVPDQGSPIHSTFAQSRPTYPLEELQHIGGSGFRGQQKPIQQMDDDYEAIHGVRRPDEAKVQRLVSSPVSVFHRMTLNSALGRAEDPSVSWMFHPPRHLSCQEPLSGAKRTAKESKKWLLVNIQSHTEFSSHMLNRDTWSNETIENIIRSSFLLWQRGHTSPEGRSFMQLYDVSDEQLPIIAIVDSRTGVLAMTLKGYIPPEHLSDALSEFLDSNSFESGTTAAHGRNIDTTGQDFSTFAGGPVAEPVSPTGPGTSSSSIRNDEDDGYRRRDDAGSENGASDGHDDDDTRTRSRMEGGKTTGQRKITTASSVDDTKAEQSNSTGPVIRTTGGGAVASCSRRPHSDYGAVPEEPPAGDSTTVRISIKVVSGKSLVRRFRKSDKCSALFAVAAAEIAEHDADVGRTVSGVDKAFDLFTPFPLTSLADKLDATFEEVGLSNTQIIMRWI